MLGVQRYNRGMRRALAIVSLGAALLAVPLAAQMRGPVQVMRPRGFAGFGNRGFFPGLGNNPHFGFLFDGNSFFFGHRRDHFGRGFAAASAYCPMYGAYPYLTGVQSTPSSYSPDEYYEQGALRRDIDTLTGKTGANEYANAQLPVAPRTRLAPPLATVLVFSDRHLQEIRD